MGGGSHRFFDHTGDFGVELHAPTRAALFEEVARAWLSLLTDAPETVAEREARTIEVQGLDDAERLVALGNELVYLFESEGWLAARLEVELDEGALDDGVLDDDAVDDDVLRARAHGEPFDPARHPIARPAKAVTHHGALFEERVEQRMWVGRLIFDL